MAWDLRTQDGIVIRGIPDDVPQDDASLKRRVAGLRDQMKMADPTAGMGFFDKFNAGMGKAFADLGRGASQLVGQGPSAEEVRETRQLDAPLMKTGAGVAGNVAGNIAAMAPLAVVPGANTVAGAGALGATAAALQPTETTGERVFNMGAGGLVGGGTQALAGPVAQRIGEGAANREAALRTQQSQNAVRDETLRMGREAGYVVPPSAVNPSTANRIIESIGGKAATGQQALAQNVPTTDALARRAGGLGEADALSVENLRTARQRMAQPYRDISAISPQAANDLSALQQARFDSKMAWKEHNRLGARTAYNDAIAADARAEALANALEQHAQGAGRPELVQALQQARQQIAQNRLVQESVNRGAGHADPSVFGRALDRDVPIRGDALTIGRMHQAFPDYMKDVSGKQAPGTNNLHAWLAALMAGGGGAAGGIPGAVLGATVPFAVPPAARAAALSGPYQSAMATPNYQAGGVTRAMAGLEDPETRRRLALLARSLSLPAIPEAVNQ